MWRSFPQDAHRQPTSVDPRQLPRELREMIAERVPIHALSLTAAAIALGLALASDVRFAHRHLCAQRRRACLFEWLDAHGIRGAAFCALPFAYRVAVWGHVLSADEWCGVPKLPVPALAPHPFTDMAANKFWLFRWPWPERDLLRATRILTDPAECPWFCATAQHNRPARYAARMGHLNVLRILVEAHGADPADYGNYAICCAAESGELAVMEYLLQFPSVDPSANRNYPLRVAAQMGHANIVALLLKQSSADPSVNSNFAIILASRNGHLEVVEQLLESRRVDPSANACEAFRQACAYGHGAVVSRLLMEPATNPTILENEGFQLACDNGHVAVVQLLLNDGRVNPSAHYASPLRLGVSRARLDVVNLLRCDPRMAHVA
ncbi:hypothetical protein HDU82_000813 [Entophlyctis luteolus]|nr:hypothetical protein HDU82_000813 [Entophlyctis luteolus]